MESKKNVRFTVRLDEVLLRKLEYVAAFDGRTRNEECELMIREWVRAFEDVDGEIVVIEKK